VFPVARRPTILVVEDDEEVRAFYRTALTIAGFVVVAVEDGIDALRYLECDQPKCRRPRSRSPLREWT
jgi:DNA-binding response OmpR family regulator